MRDAFDGDVEPQLVDDIRADACYRPELALVAEVDGAVVGHVMISWCEVHDEQRGTSHRVGLLSPLAVDPAHQRDGIGGALVREVCARADAAGDPLVVLEGSPAYYPRFGFVDARTHGITLPLPDWAPPEAGQVLPLTADDPAITGRVVYPPPFEGVD